MRIIIILVFILIVVFIVKNKFSSKLSINELQKNAYTILNKTDGVYENISKEDVKKMIEEKSAIVLDVRNTNEIKNTGKLRGSINIPLGELENRLGDLNQEQAYITFCAVGGRSKKAAAILSNSGFKKVYNSKEGMNTWNHLELIEK